MTKEIKRDFKVFRVIVRRPSEVHVTIPSGRGLVINRHSFIIQIHHIVISSFEWLVVDIQGGFRPSDVRLKDLNGSIWFLIEHLGPQM